MTIVPTCIIGVAQQSYRDVPAVEDPARLMIGIARRALQDAGIDDVRILDAIAVVDPFSWTYEDVSGLVARELGLRDDVRTIWKPAGGTTPQDLLHEIGAAIGAGEIGTALIVGAEAMRTRRKATRAGEELPWPPRDRTVNPMRGQAPFSSELEARHGLRLPIQVFPMIENALRHAHRRSAQAQIALAASLLEKNARIAERNPNAWFRDAPTAAEIAAVTEDNRMISYPYTKRMNAIMDVDQAAALVVASGEFVRAHGLGERAAAVLGGAGAEEVWNPVERDELGRCVAMEVATRQALAYANIAIDDVSGFDFYSCFPCAIELGLDAARVPVDDPRDFSLTGGLAYAGGPGNAYVMHSLATAVERLRARTGERLMVTGIGMANTKHATTVLASGSNVPRGASGRTDYRIETGARARDVVAAPEGRAAVVTWTVEYDREGCPAKAIYILEMADGRRTVANAADPVADEPALMSRDPVGRSGTVFQDPEQGLNVFRLD